MKSIGFPISTKENEKRRTITPLEIKTLSFPEAVFIETGYGKVLNIDDCEFEKAGATVCTKKIVLQQDIICDPKVGDADYLDLLGDGQIIFGWVHATQNRDITNKIIDNKLTAYAWEKMYEEGKHVFWFNNELAGEAAILHAFQCFGQLPNGLNVAVIGRGNTARGAVRALNSLDANITQFNRNQEQDLRDNIGEFDVVVNCVLWDVKRTDHIIYKKDLAKMKANSMIIDVSCDKNGGVESTIPTSINNPTYVVDGVVHYAVDHTPAIFYKTFSFNNSKIVKKYIDMLMTNEENSVLRNSLIAKNGVILDKEIIEYQHLSQ